MRRGIPLVRAWILTSAAALIAAGIAAPSVAPSAEASTDEAHAAPRSLSDDTVLGTFSAVGGGTDFTVLSVALQGDDTLYAGGVFSAAGGIPDMNGIAAWSKADDTWHALGGGMGGGVYALAVTGDDSLYAGGDFTSAIGVAGTRNIAAWSNRDDTWHPLGSGMPDDGSFALGVRSLAVQGDDTVYAGGEFPSASGVSNTGNMAAWSNADDTWHALGVGAAGLVQALVARADDTVYAAGAFGDMSGAPGTNAIAAWSNADDTWHALGEGMGNPVNALAAAGDDTLYSGGDFLSASGVAGTRYTAAWSNTDDTWYALGGELSYLVTALAFDDTHGLLYTGGAFSTAGTTAASLVAVWDGGIDAWIPLQAAGGNGASGTAVRAFAVDDSIVFLGGSFSQAGGVSGTTNIAKGTWDPPSAEAVPASGAAGTTTQLKGSGLIGVTDVRLDGSPVSYSRDDSTTITVTIPGGLSAGARSLRVDAVGGTAVATYTVSASPSPAFPPGAPTGASAVAGDASASVSWLAPADSGAYAISTYQATSSPGGRSCLVSAPALTCEVSGLTNGTSYAFTVRALNGAGWGPSSASSNAVTPSASATKSIVITGSRNASDSRYVLVSGTAAGLEGRQVTPWVRFPGEARYAAGSGVQTVKPDGTFEWTRKSGRKTYVYFTHESVKSNTVTIPDR